MKKNKSKQQNNKLKCRYGITYDDYNRMYEQQKGCCKLCGTDKKRLVIEHNHRNGQVRGLTCDRCNLTLAVLEDRDYDFIDRIHTYLYTDGKMNV